MVIQRTQMADHDRTLAVYAASNGLRSVQHMCQISHGAESLDQPVIMLQRIKNSKNSCQSVFHLYESPGKSVCGISHSAAWAFGRKM
jgi:hypothetical protein